MICEPASQRSRIAKLGFTATETDGVFAETALNLWSGDGTCTMFPDPPRLKALRQQTSQAVDSLATDI
jgi:hypothetical protein